MSPRPQIDHIRRPQILSAAGEVIAERGVASTRIADIAKRVGTSGPALLYWFDSKDEILSEALGYAENDFYEKLSERLASLADPGERLRLLIEAAVDDYDWTLWMELWTRALRDAGSAATRLELDRRWRGAIEDEVRAGQEASDFADGEAPERVAAILASLIDGLAVQATLGDPEMPAEQMRELATAIAERLLETELPRGEEPTTEETNEGGREPLSSKEEKR